MCSMFINGRAHGLVRLRPARGGNALFISGRSVLTPFAFIRAARIPFSSKEGKTLYIFTKDAAGKSNCNGGCAGAWPPFAVANPALAGGDFSIVTRDDGAKQWAHQGKPLYFYAADTAAGDMKGEGQGGVWYTIKAKK